MFVEAWMLLVGVAGSSYLEWRGSYMLGCLVLIGNLVRNHLGTIFLLLAFSLTMQNL